MHVTILMFISHLDGIYPRHSRFTRSKHVRQFLCRRSLPSIKSHVFVWNIRPSPGPLVSMKYMIKIYCITSSTQHDPALIYHSCTYTTCKKYMYAACSLFHVQSTYDGYVFEWPFFAPDFQQLLRHGAIVARLTSYWFVDEELVGAQEGHNLAPALSCCEAQHCYLSNLELSLNYSEARIERFKQQVSFRTWLDFRNFIWMWSENHS